MQLYVCVEAQTSCFMHGMLPFTIAAVCVCGAHNNKKQAAKRDEDNYVIGPCNFASTINFSILKLFGY